MHVTLLRCHTKRRVDPGRTYSSHFAKYLQVDNFSKQPLGPKQPLGVERRPDRLGNFNHHAMATCCRWSLLAVASAAVALVVFVSLVDCTSPRHQDGYIVDGRVKLGVGMDAVSRKANIKVVLNGGQKVTYVHSNGYFAILGVAPGTHLLEVVAPGYVFPPVRLDVSERLHGQVHAVYTETRRILQEPLTLEPEKAEYYYEKRAPVSVVGLLKSPMGMMVGLMLLAVVLLPKLVDSIDPEEMKRVQEEMRNQPTPSFSNLLQGRSS